MSKTGRNACPDCGREDCPQQPDVVTITPTYPGEEFPPETDEYIVNGYIPGLGNA